ncbi:reverse transcriptase-like protein [Virgibacillus senegalensis]|uniref:reverse transcriptase-like protein n=1 Tax=Virgibacillus senegalensis TaxID=1499679 RepID=UPI00069DF23E|nr:reverse transcriptase-like protein [Virgibacillus senegalensis]
MIEVYTDGASSGDPGLSGAGIYIKAKKKIFEYRFPLGSMSNHEAEFQAVIKGLEICRENFPDEILSFRSDSKLVVDVVEKDFTKNQKFLPFLHEIRLHSEAFQHFFIKWIPEKQNQHADNLARQAIQLN